MKFTTAMLFGLALIVGVAVGYMFNPSVEDPKPEPKHEKASVIRDEGDGASVKALRARIAELEAKLAGKDKAEPSEAVASENGDGRRENRGWGGMSPKEWREKMKRENPGQYVQMTNGIARMRRERHERAQRKSDFFASIDVSRMAPAARKVHEELRDLIAKSEEFEQRMHELQASENDLSMEEMGAMFREMHETHRRIGELSAQERDNLMTETVKGLGFSDEDSGEVTEVFKEIIENTDNGWGGFGGGRGRGGRGGNRRHDRD